MGRSFINDSNLSTSYRDDSRGTAACGDRRGVAVILIHQQPNNRPYAPMTVDDVNYINRRKRDYKTLLGVRQAALMLGLSLKAAAARSEADAIGRELRLKYDIIL